MSDTIVSIIGNAYLDSIASLIEGLESLDRHGPNEVQVSSKESGYSVSIIMLSVLMLESFLVRLKYLDGDYNKDHVLIVAKNNLSPELFNTAEELFTIRDVIAHNHVWEAEIEFDDDYQMKLLSAHLLPGYGNTRFNRVVDKDKRKTKLLGLNAFPSRIGRADVLIVLDQLLECLEYLRKNRKNSAILVNSHVRYKGRLVSFSEILQTLIDQNSIATKDLST